MQTTSLDSIDLVQLQHQLGISLSGIKNTLALLADDATVPFIARYRKEMTGGLDEVQIIAIRDSYDKALSLHKRKEFVIESIGKQDKMSPEILAAIAACKTMSELEDLYLPYKTKKQTRASSARKKGLQGLADELLKQDGRDPLLTAQDFVNLQLGVETTLDALQGARDILAETFSEHAKTRQSLRQIFTDKALLRSKLVKKKEELALKYRDYFDVCEPAHKTPAHRLLAMLRANEEGFVTLHVLPDEELAVASLRSLWLKAKNKAGAQVELALNDSYQRLIAPSLENERLGQLKEKADSDSIAIFANNLRELLLAAPAGAKRLVALDPGLRTGCKVVVLSAEGHLLEHHVIYPLEPHKKTDEAQKLLQQICLRHKTQLVAIGNGTGGRECEAFLRTIDFEHPLGIVMVNESGASIYSASECARKEFPDYDLTVRGAVSIGRRLLDPLSELVKLDPKSIGVGQYQHDVDQKLLKQTLDDTVRLCVNAVGVEVNTASPELLSYVSGINSKTAQKIVERVQKKGPFGSRAELKTVPGLGDKTFEQAAGFLRIANAVNPLDTSAVHPERYDLVSQICQDLGTTLTDLVGKEDVLAHIDTKRYVSDSVGLPTLTDICKELGKPGRDPRSAFELSEFSDGINSIEDLQVGMQLKGVVTNVAAFGAFVDIGVHQDGLVHISELSNTYVSNIHELVKVTQKVDVLVKDVDLARRRISLSMKK